MLKGPPGVEKFFTGLFGAGVTNHKLELIKAHGDGTMLYGTAKWSAQGKDNNGQPATFSGIAMHVFEKQADGSWKLRAQTFN